MSERSGFFPAELVNGQYDREYDHVDFALRNMAMVSTGVQFADDSLRVVSGAGMTVTVNPGFAWIQGYTYSLNKEYANMGGISLSLPVADGTNPRVDRILLRWDFANKEIKCVVSPGTPSAAPKGKDLVRNELVYELCLAEVNIAVGAISILPTSVIDRRGDATLCPWAETVVRGKVGPAGAYVSSASIDTNGNLLLHMSTGTQLNAGYAKGPKGDPGTGAAGDIGDRISTPSLLSTGNYVPCNGGIIDEAYRDNLRGFPAAHDYIAMRGQGGQTTEVVRNSEQAYFNTLMASNGSTFVVVTGNEATDSVNGSKIGAETTVQGGFGIFSSTNPDQVAFEQRVFTQTEYPIGAGYDEQTKLFWVLSVRDSGSLRYLSMRRSTDGINWSMNSSPSIRKSVVAICNTKAKAGRIFTIAFAASGSGNRSYYYDLTTISFVEYPYPVSLTTVLPSRFYVADDGKHLVMSMSTAAYMTNNTGANWEAMQAPQSTYKSVAYLVSSGTWILESGNFYRRRDTDGVWANTGSIGRTTAMTRGLTMSTGGAYLWAMSAAGNYPPTANPNMLFYTANGSSWTLLQEADIWGTQFDYFDTTLMSSNWNPGRLNVSQQILIEHEGKLVLCSMPKARAGAWNIALLDKTNVLDTATGISWGSDFSAENIQSLCWTKDKATGLIHVYGVSGVRDVRMFTISVKNNLLHVEESTVFGGRLAGAMSAPWVGQDVGGVSALSGWTPRTTHFAPDERVNGFTWCEDMLNNSAMAVDFKGDFKMVSAGHFLRVNAGTTYASTWFRTAGTSLCARKHDGMFLRIK